MSFIYRLDDPRDNSFRYVGRTRNIKQRLISHSTLADGNPRKQQWICELRDLGLHPILTVIEEVKDEDAKSRERYWVRTYLEQGIPLLNSLRAIGLYYVNQWGLPRDVVISHM